MARTSDFTTKLALELKDAHAYECDVSDARSIQEAFNKITNELGEIDIVIYNAGSGSWGNIEEIKPDAFEASWRVNTFGLLTIGQTVIPGMKKKAAAALLLLVRLPLNVEALILQPLHLPKLLNEALLNRWQNIYGPLAFMWL